MKLFIGDSTKLDNYVLPDEAKDSFLINYVSSNGINENILIKAINGKWTISQAVNFIVKRDLTSITTDELIDGNFYDIKFGDIEENIKLYCYDLPMKYESYTINKATLTIGRENSDIIYNNISSNNISITKENEKWTLKVTDSNLYVYVSGIRVTNVLLKRGDIIFTNGLKIIWMENFILVNHLQNRLKVNLEPYKTLNTLGQDNLYTPVKDKEKYVTLYNDSDVFFHTPRLKSDVENKVIKISPPPDKIVDEGPPVFLTLGATIMMGISSSITGTVAIFNVASGNRTLLSSITEISICFAMVLGCAFFPILLDKYKKKMLKKKEDQRQTKYTEYLNKKKQEIKSEMEKQSSILSQNNLSVEQLLNEIKNKSNKVWCREIGDIDFLTYRLGIGDRKANLVIDTNLEDFRLESDDLKEEVEKLSKTKFVLKDVPVTISNFHDRILPLIISKDYEHKQQVIDNIMLQLMTYHSGTDLKIAILTDKFSDYDWKKYKCLPHCVSNDNTAHFYAENEDEMKQLSAYLENVYSDRLAKIKQGEVNEESDTINTDDSYKQFDEYYLIITDNYILAKQFGIIDKILNSNVNIGFSLLTIEPTLQNIPSRCEQFVQIGNEEAKIDNKDLNVENQNIFNPDIVDYNIEDYIKTIANIPAAATSLINQLPASINFLEMYNVGNVEQLNILNRWKTNDPTISLKAPVGVREDGKLFELDLHEKYHGPHGLIAGSTGSGKSEFIITYILSMAINYHPNEVQFVLIDYKGGGLAGAFENRETGFKLPHLVGTITNLDEGEINRTLVSINSELKRRQRMFNEARDLLGESTVDIYKYQKFYREGKVKEPISHLFIVSDEFAELKAQQPDFMDELISTARIGRSLGVHLILATQKPSGVVNEQIWSNAKFKVCLKVQTSEDSVEMLKRPDAASIKEAGRFYLQVGYDELFELGQSAWTGARYVPLERVERTIDDSIIFIDDNGNVVRRVTDNVKNSQQVNYGDQLSNINKALYNIAKRENISDNQLWLPSIPENIYLSDTIKKYNYATKKYSINPIIGEYDKPTSQQQNMLTIDFNNTGNLLIYGNPGSGKENLIATLVYSICLYHLTNEVNFYIIDLGAETLKIFNSMPQVGDVVLVEDKDKLISLFLMLERELNRRKDLFSDYGGSYNEYIKNSENKLPMIVVILNGYESFVENYGNYDDIYVHLTRESAKYGIVFIMTAVMPNSVRVRLSQTFGNKLALQLSDNYEYKFTLGAPDGLTPSRYFGRGIVAKDDTAYEFQTCHIYQKDKINDVIRSAAAQVSSLCGKARSIPVVPKTINYDTLSVNIDSANNVPVGINIFNAEVSRFDILKNKVSQIIGNNLLIDNGFVNNFASIMAATPNIKFKVIDFVDCITDPTNLTYINDNFTKNIGQIASSERQDVINVYLILGIGYIYDKVLDQGIGYLFDVFNNMENYPNSYFIFADNYSSYKRIMKEPWYQKIVNVNDGIWIGQGVEAQQAIHINNMLSCDANESFNSLGYIVKDGEYVVAKCLGASEGGDSY